MLCLYGFHELPITSSMGQHPDLQCITTKLTHSTQTGWLEHGVHAGDYLAPLSTAKKFADACDDVSRALPWRNESVNKLFFVELCKGNGNRILCLFSWLGVIAFPLLAIMPEINKWIAPSLLVAQRATKRRCTMLNMPVPVRSPKSNKAIEWETPWDHRVL